MTIEEVLRKWEGKRYQESPQYWYQCVAAVKLFVKEMWWTPLGRFWGVWAYQWRINNNNTFPVSDYQKVANDPNLYPVKWDIVIFRPVKGNPHWHIGICVDANLDIMNIWSQNWETGNWLWLWGDAIVKRNYTYKDCAGWYHYKKQKGSDNLSPTIDPDIQWLIDDWIFNGEYEPMDNKRLIKIIGKLYNKVK